MLLDDYQQSALTTAVYPRQYRLVYPKLGLVAEVGELLNKYKKVLRGDKAEAAFAAEFVGEAGDICWYCAVLALDAGLELSDVLGCDTFGELQKLAGRHHTSLLDAVMNLAVCGSPILEDRWHSALQSTMYALARLATLLSVDMGAVAQLNLEKLAERARAGTLKGDGDTR